MRAKEESEPKDIRRKEEEAHEEGSLDPKAVVRLCHGSTGVQVLASTSGQAVLLYVL